MPHMGGKGLGAGEERNGGVIRRIDLHRPGAVNRTAMRTEEGGSSEEIVGKALVREDVRGEMSRGMERETQKASRGGVERGTVRERKSAGWQTARREEVGD